MAPEEMNVAEPLTISIEEAAQLLGISRTHAYKCAQTGEMPTIRMGGRILVVRDKLMERLEELQGGSAECTDKSTNGPVPMGRSPIGSGSSSRKIG